MRTVVSAITLPRTGTYGKRAQMQGQQARPSNSPLPAADEGRDGGPGANEHRARREP
jgi:hypothetical protein